MGKLGVEGVGNDIVGKKKEGGEGKWMFVHFLSSFFLPFFFFFPPFAFYSFPPPPSPQFLVYAHVPTSRTIPVLRLAQLRFSIGGQFSVDIYYVFFILLSCVCSVAIFSPLFSVFCVCMWSGILACLH